MTRISCLAFARIPDGNGNYAVVINKGRLEHNGEFLLSPFGGGLEHEPEGLAYLKAIGAYEFEGEDEGKKELRFQIPDVRLERVIEWFGSGHGRERTVLRELTEETVKETGILSRDSVSGTTEVFHTFARYDGQTRRKVSNKNTVYLIDVYNVRLPSDALSNLVAASRFPVEERLAYFVSRDEIMSGLSSHGTAIGGITTTIL